MFPDGNPAVGIRLVIALYRHSDRNSILFTSELVLLDRFGDGYFSLSIPAAVTGNVTMKVTKIIYS